MTSSEHAAEALPTGAVRRFGAIRLYAATAGHDQSRLCDFHKACGYNDIEYCEGGFGQRPDRDPAYHADVAASISAAQRKDFKVWILRLARTKQWNGPAVTGWGRSFSALSSALLDARLARVRETVSALSGADDFEFFAGDAGGDIGGPHPSFLKPTAPVAPGE